jgi:hypothetical protein
MAEADPIFQVLGSRTPPDIKEPCSWSVIRTDLPFSPEDVTGHALHPDGRTLFVSVETPTGIG